MIFLGEQSLDNVTPASRTVVIVPVWQLKTIAHQSVNPSAIDMTVQARLDSIQPTPAIPTQLGLQIETTNRNHK